MDNFNLHEYGKCEWCGVKTKNRWDIKPDFQMWVYACPQHQHLIEPEHERKRKAYLAKSTRRKNESKKRTEAYQKGR
jgi:hypothetical protein